MHVDEVDAAMTPMRSITKRGMASLVQLPSRYVDGGLVLLTLGIRGDGCEASLPRIWYIAKAERPTIEPN